MTFVISHWSPGFTGSWEMVVFKLGTLEILLIRNKRRKEIQGKDRGRQPRVSALTSQELMV